MDYFDHIINRLTNQDFELLTFLAQESATKPLRAKNKQEITERTNFTDGIYRKIVARLETLYLIESVGEGRAYAYFLTDYGIAAFERLLNEIQENNQNNGVDNV